MLHQVFIGLGSNLGDRYEYLNLALQLLDDKVGCVERVSSFIETEPWGFVSSFAFVNAVAVCLTPHAPLGLLDITQQIERELGRLKKSFNGVYQDRPIDIDILLYDQIILETDRLTIPHALMHERPFVLESMRELAPDLLHPVLGVSMHELMQRLS